MKMHVYPQSLAERLAARLTQIKGRAFTVAVAVGGYRVVDPDEEDIGLLDEYEASDPANGVLTVYEEPLDKPTKFKSFSDNKIMAKHEVSFGFDPGIPDGDHTAMWTSSSMKPGDQVLIDGKVFTLQEDSSLGPFKHEPPLGKMLTKEAHELMHLYAHLKGVDVDQAKTVLKMLTYNQAYDGEPEPVKETIYHTIKGVGVLGSSLGKVGWNNMDAKALWDFAMDSQALKGSIELNEMLYKMQSSTNAWVNTLWNIMVNKHMKATELDFIKAEEAEDAIMAQLGSDTKAGLPLQVWVHDVTVLASDKIELKIAVGYDQVWTSEHKMYSLKAYDISPKSKYYKAMLHLAKGVVLSMHNKGLHDYLGVQISWSLQHMAFRVMVFLKSMTSEHWSMDVSADACMEAVGGLSGEAFNHLIDVHMNGAKTKLLPPYAPPSYAAVYDMVLAELNSHLKQFSTYAKAWFEAVVPLKPTDNAINLYIQTMPGKVVTLGPSEYNPDNAMQLIVNAADQAGAHTLMVKIVEMIWNKASLNGAFDIK